MRCHRKTATGAQCPAEGIWDVVLVLQAWTGARLMAPLPFAVCEEHRRDSTVPGLLSEGDWSRIRNSFRREGLVVPERWMATLAFRKRPVVEVS